MNIQITRVTLNDIDQLQKVGQQTFSETFSAVNSEENMKKYLEEAFSAETLAAEITNIDSEFYFATLDNKVIGYLKVNFGASQTDLKDDRALEIERIYVLRDFHRKKVGQLLFDKALLIAQQRNASYIWLGVWEANHRAQRFYCQNGFEVFDKHQFRLGNDIQTDLMMKLTLKR